MTSILYHSSQQDFIEALGLTDNKVSSGVFILDINDISEKVARTMQVYRNEFYEINLIKNQWNFKFTVDDYSYHPQGEPYLAFIAPSQLQTYEVLGDDPESSGYLIYINKDTYRGLNLMEDFPFFKRNQESILTLSESQSKELLQIATNMETEFKKKTRYSHDILQSFTKIFLLKACSFFESLQVKVNRPHQLIARFESLINHQYIRHKSVKFYADELAISIRQLSNLTNETIGKSPLQVIHDIIISESKALLSNSKMTTTEVAYALGFEEVAHFSRFFKKHATLTPSEYRKTTKIDNTIS